MKMKTRKISRVKTYLRSDYIDRLRMQGSAAFEANISSICEVHKLKQLKVVSLPRSQSASTWITI